MLQSNVILFQSLLFLLSGVCFSGEITNYNIIIFGLKIMGFEPMIYHKGGKHINRFTTYAVMIGQKFSSTSILKEAVVVVIAW